MMQQFNIERLPDDVLRLLFEHWLCWSIPKHICNIDSALCNSSIRNWYLKFVRSRGVPLTCHMFDFRSHANRYDGFVRWLLARRFPLDRIDVALNSETLRLLHCEAENYSVLGSVRDITISSCHTHDAAVAPNLLRALVAEAPNVTTLTLQLGLYYDFTDSIPWDILLCNRNLSKLSIWLGKGSAGSAPLLNLPRVVQQLPSINNLEFRRVQFEWGELDALLSSCPNLSSLSLENVGFRSVPSRDVMIAERATALVHLKKVSVPDNDVVAEYLLRRCPNVESVRLSGGTFEWLPSMLQSSAVPCLRSLQVSTVFHMDLDIADNFAIQAQSSEPFQFTELCGDGYPTFQLLRLLQSVRPAKFSVSLLDRSGTFFQRHLCVADFESLPLTRLHVGFEAEYGNAEEWMFMLQLPRLEQLEVADEMELEPGLDNEDTDVGDVLGECVELQRERGISPSSRLQELSCSCLRLYTAVNHLVQLLPHLSTLGLWNCRLNTDTMTTFIVGLPSLSRLDVHASFGHTMVEYDFRGVDFAGRPRMFVVADNDLLPTWAVLKSFVVGLGSHLEEIEIEEPFADLLAEPDVEFLAQNKHVSVIESI